MLRARVVISGCNGGRAANCAVHNNQVGKSTTSKKIQFELALGIRWVYE
jgi:hypothetical protein